MRLIVDYDELSNTGKYFDEKAKEIEDTLNNIRYIVNNIDSSWEGIDMETFVLKANDILDEQDDKKNDFELIGQMIGIISNNYKYKDNEWNEKMKKEYLDEYNNQGTRV